MSRFRDAASILISSKSPMAFGTYCINMGLYALRSKKRIKRIPVTRFSRDGKSYYARSWDGLLVIRPGHEPKVNAAVRKIAEQEPGGIFVNVGAHIGRYAIEFAEHFDRTIAYEPTPDTFALLWKAASEHRAQIVARRMCVSDRSGRVMFVVSSSESQNSMMNEGVNAMMVPAVSLDDDLKDDEKRAIRLLLIDVEGAEHLVLQGARETLTVGNPSIVAEFLSEERRLDCDGLLRELGYEGERIDPTNWLYKPIRRLSHR